MTFLNKESIFNANDIRISTVSVPEWGGELRIKSLSVAERDLLTDKIKNAGDSQAKISIGIVIMTVIDNNGNKVFSDSDYDALANKSAPVIERIALEALRINGLNPDAVEQAEKN